MHLKHYRNVVKTSGNRMMTSVTIYTMYTYIVDVLTGACLINAAWYHHRKLRNDVVLHLDIT